MGKVLYSAVVLDEKSKGILLNELSNIIPDDWKIFAHHMTINLGEINDDQKDDLGLKVPIKATHLGVSDKAIAVKVTGYPSKNDIPHITIAVNVKEGGKPVMSNYINDWDDLSSIIGKNEIVLQGTVEEIEAK